MILDNSQIFSDGQAITANAVSTNILALGVAVTLTGHTKPYARDKGEGKEVPLLVQVTQDFNNVTSLTVALEVSDTEDFAVAKVAVQSAAVPLADLKAGYRFAALSRLPRGLTGNFIRLRYTIAGTAPTTGRVTAAISTGVDSFK